MASLLSIGLAGAAWGEPAAPWGDEPFALTPEQLLEIAAEIPVPEEADAHVLFRERHVVLDEEGLATERRWHIYRIYTDAGRDENADLEADWRPWHQQRTEARARVITADGDEYWLDPETVAEVPVPEVYQGRPTDRRMLQAPLPAVAIGALLEIETVRRDFAPFFRGGQLFAVALADVVPVAHTRLVLEAPAGLPLHHWKQLAPESGDPIMEETGTGRRWTFEAGPFEAADDPVEPLTPGEVPLWPIVVVATGESWGVVARSYAELVDDRIRGLELGSVAADLVDGASTRRDRIERASDWVRKEIRYSGLPFGESGIAPSPAAETVERKYGDCKDLSTVLVALLRAAGTPAYVALVRNGPGPDIWPQLPALGAFDHAIVYVPGEPELWIDPTAEFAPTGELSLWTQGRWALIASAETTDLTPTPEAESGENRIVLRAEIHFQDMDGSARVVENMSARGSIARAFRTFIQQSDQETIQSYFERHAKSHYSGERLKDWTHSAATDLTAPFESRIEAEELGNVSSSLTSVAVKMPTDTLLARLSKFLTDDFADNEREVYGRSYELGDDPREHDMLLPEPHVVETVHRIVPAAGYRAASYPESEVRRLGPMTLVTEVTVESGSAVVVTQRFDTVKRRLTPAEVEAFRADLAEFEAAEEPAVVFEQVGETRLAEGKIGEALAEFRRLAELEPENALHRVRIARALLTAGLGDAARRQAREAAELQPDSEWVQQALGHVLMHDHFGRVLGEGFDLEGATAAFRRAKELNPERPVHRQNLIVALELTPEGEKYSDGERLEEAIREYRALREELQISSFDGRLLTLLVATERYEEAEEVARQAAPSAFRHGTLLTAVAFVDGPSAAFREASRIRDVGERRQALNHAIAALFRKRRYPEAVELLKAATGGDLSRAPAAFQRLAEARPYEELLLPDDDPRSVYQREAIEFELPPFLWPEYEDEGLGEDNLLDLLFTFSEYEIDKDFGGDGYLLRAELSIGFSEVHEMSDFSVRDGERYRTLAGPGDLAKRVLEHVERGELATARRWLDHVASGEAPHEPFRRFWSEGSQAGPETIRWAAASLMVEGEEAESAIPILEAGRSQASSDEEREDFDFALAHGLTWLGRTAELLPVAQRLYEREPESEFAFLQLLKALRREKHWEAYRQAAERRLEATPEYDVAIRVISRYWSEHGDLEESVRLLQQLDELGEAGANDYNGLAWRLLILGNDLDGALAAAEKAVELSATAVRLHTLASVYAARGQSEKARDALWEAMQWRAEDEPPKEISPHYDGYVWGRIAENYGLRELAVELYRQVELEADENPALATFRMAEQRLDELSKPAASAE